jgi:DNA-binding LytR/AlgR family response regulator
MSELATAAKPAGIIAKTSRRAAVGLTMSIGVGLLMMSVWRSSPSSLFLRTINTVRLISIDDVDYLRSDAKYTIVAWRDGGKPAEAVVRTPLKELLEQLDAEQFAQVHRSIVVNLRAISHVKRHDNETAEIHLRGRDDVLPVSRNYLHLFRQM